MLISFVAKFAHCCIEDYYNMQENYKLVIPTPFGPNYI